MVIKKNILYLAPNLSTLHSATMMLYPGMPVYIVCIFNGVPQPMIFWVRDGMNLVNGSGISISNSMNTSELTVIDNAGEQGGEYNCSVSNVIGSATLIFMVECKV